MLEPSLLQKVNELGLGLISQFYWTCAEESCAEKDNTGNAPTDWGFKK